MKNDNLFIHSDKPDKKHAPGGETDEQASIQAQETIKVEKEKQGKVKRATCAIASKIDLGSVGSLNGSNQGFKLLR